MSGIAGLRRALIGCAVFFGVTAAAALAANPVDRSFGVKGIAEIEARVPGTGQVGGVVDLEPGGGGKLLAAVYPMAREGHYFAAAMIRPNGRLDRGFGREGFTPPIRAGRSEVEKGGHLQAEAVARQADGKVVLAGYRDAYGAFVPALARFTAKGHLDPSFGDGGKVFPLPFRRGRRMDPDAGGTRLHDVAVEPDGTIVAAADVVPHPYRLPINGPGRARAEVVAYRPDGKIDRGFGHDGRFTVTPPRSSAYTGFSSVKALPSGKLLVSGYLRQQLVLYRLTANGRLDRSFGRDGRVTVGGPSVYLVYARGAYLRAPFAVDRHGRIVFCGLLYPDKGRSIEEPVAFLRLLPDGRRDRSFGRSRYMERAPVDAREPYPRKHGVQGFSFEPQAIAIDGHGRVLVSGGELAPYVRGQQEAGYEYFTSRRFLPNGRRDRHFGEGGVWHTNPPGSQSLARAALTQPNGQVVAAGWVQIERFGGNGPGNTAMMLTRFR